MGFFCKNKKIRFICGFFRRKRAELRQNEFHLYINICMYFVILFQSKGLGHRTFLSILTSQLLFFQNPTVPKSPSSSASIGDHAPQPSGDSRRSLARRTEAASPLSSGSSLGVNQVYISSFSTRRARFFVFPCHS